MKVKVNGKEIEVASGLSVAKFLFVQKIDPKNVVVEHNFKILKPKESDELIINEGDSLEIISFVGGG